MYSRFFTRSLKLDYPNQETSKASKKYVRAMKNLHVSKSSRLKGIIAKPALGGHSCGYGVQQAVPRPSRPHLHVRSKAASHGQAGTQAPLVQGDDYG